MPLLVDNMYHYIAYGLILVIFLIVLKMPKNKKENKRDREEE